jgi:hypothetical protein
MEEGGRSMKTAESSKARLERGFHILQRILLRRALEGSTMIGWGVERAIVDRELQELEDDLRQHPIVPPMAGWIIRDNIPRRGSIPNRSPRRTGHPTSEGA